MEYFKIASKKGYFLSNKQSLVIKLKETLIDTKKQQSRSKGYNKKMKLYSKYKTLINEYIKYNIVGTLNFLSCQTIYIVLINIFKIYYILAYTICNIISAIISYVFNSRITFNNNKFKISNFIKVYISHLSEYILNLILITLMVENLNISKSFAPMIAPIITTPIAFYLVKKSIKKTVKNNSF